MEKPSEKHSEKQAEKLVEEPSETLKQNVKKMVRKVSCFSTTLFSLFFLNPSLSRYSLTLSLSLTR